MRCLFRVVCSCVVRVLFVVVCGLLFVVRMCVVRCLFSVMCLVARVCCFGV